MTDKPVKDLTNSPKMRELCSSILNELTDEQLTSLFKDLPLFKDLLKGSSNTTEVIKRLNGPEVIYYVRDFLRFTLILTPKNPGIEDWYNVRLTETLRDGNIHSHDLYSVCSGHWLRPDIKRHLKTLGYQEISKEAWDDYLR